MFLGLKSSGSEPVVDTPAKIDASGAFAPAPASIDIQGACSALPGVIKAYGQEPGGFPFSVVAWLGQVVNLTELMGATGYDYGLDGLSPSEEDVAYAAANVRTVTIGGGLSHPQFPVVMAALMDACKALPASSA
jgi:hypothetical protein